MMDLYIKIKQLREKRGLSQQELAEMTGYSNRSAIARIENGSIDIPQSKIMAFCKALKTTPEYLMSPLEKIINIVKIPLYDHISCGTGMFVDEQPEDYIAVPDKYLKAGVEYFANTAHGDSMIGKGIKDGDVLVFEKVSHLENGQIGAFCIDNESAYCKIYRCLPNGMIMLESANANYDPIMVDVANECFRIIGKYKFKFSVEQ